MTDASVRQRLAAILSADAAGYSRLMARDEQSTISSLQAAREIFRHAIEGRSGRVVDTAGDSVLAIFETAIGAVTAALEVQAKMGGSTNGMPFRIGVHLADVFELPDGTVYGDGVNVAARLQAIVEPGGIALSDVARSAIKGKLSVDVQDAGEHRLKNIPEPLRVFKVVSGRAPTASAQPPESDALLSHGHSSQLTFSDKPSIAVLPFTNMSADPEQEYFCDGVCDDIITELSRFHSLFVIARNSSFTYKGRAVDVRTVAKELGVRYVLEGGVRRTERRLRVNAQLIDALTGTHLWAEKYDRDVTQIFDVQEELTQRIVVTIAPFIEEAERERLRRRPQDVGAYEIGVRAMAKAHEAYRSSDPRIIDEAVGDARTALRIDPRSVISLVALAFCQWQRLALARPSMRTKSGEKESVPRREQSMPIAMTAWGTCKRRCCWHLHLTSTAGTRLYSMRDEPTNSIRITWVHSWFWPLSKQPQATRVTRSDTSRKCSGSARATRCVTPSTTNSRQRTSSQALTPRGRGMQR